MSDYVSYSKNRRNRKKQREALPEGAGLAIKLMICVTLCAATWGLRQLYPQGAQAVGSVINGDASYAQAFSTFGQSVYEDGEVVSALRELYSSVFSEPPEP